jgi:pimeloyl-ACP methyl ester carboxylesterase
MGGWVALQFALARPERVRRIFLADSAGITFDIPFESTLFYPQTEEQAQHLLAQLTPQGHRVPRFVARDIVRHVTTRAGIAQRCMQSMMAGEDLLDGRLAAIRVPVLNLWGKQDAIIPIHCGMEMHRQIPQLERGSASYRLRQQPLPSAANVTTQIAKLRRVLLFVGEKPRT